MKRSYVLGWKSSPLLANVGLVAEPRTLDPNSATEVFRSRTPATMLARVRKEARRQGDENISRLVRELLAQWLETGAAPRHPRSRKR